MQTSAKLLSEITCITTARLFYWLVLEGCPFIKEFIKILQETYKQNLGRRYALYCNTSDVILCKCLTGIIIPNPLSSAFLRNWQSPTWSICGTRNVSLPMDYIYSHIHTLCL
jgi:hypothetical protein